MKNYIFLLIIYGYLSLSSTMQAQNIRLDAKSHKPVQVSMSFQIIDGRKVMRVTKDSSVKTVDQPTFVKLDSVNFKNGVIEVKVLSRLLPTAQKDNRGFIGLAFHIKDDNSRFEAIYIRPTNGRADDQIRRNHTVQYFSYPDFPYSRLRKESPEQYETYADMGLNEWIKLKISVVGNKARLYINDSKFPAFVVNDLKLRSDQPGGIGLWVDVGTEGFFRDLRVLPADK
ncbi:hypothetical protein ACRQ5D_04865 [Mucilaginibacter sp. P25]|uniref:DUF1080 domain-containing protein n=1 Tax=Mucilaginibacter gossypii TaxID=551996 RepID=A0A1G8F0C6_9SPHI|nr:hypothetical protein [Mucilaginibacter gossypii]SDH75591.1 hypothetical protein SAMN05192573_112109 [Mucilaginibacter gossypii]